MNLFLFKKVDLSKKLKGYNISLITFSFIQEVLLLNLKNLTGINLGYIDKTFWKDWQSLIFTNILYIFSFTQFCPNVKYWFSKFTLFFLVQKKVFYIVCKSKKFVKLLESFTVEKILTSKINYNW